MTESSFANKEGYFIDASVARNEVVHDDIYINDVTANRIQVLRHEFHDLKDTNYGLSLKIGKRFNIKNTSLFLSPAISYDHINNSVKDNNNFEYEIKNRIVADISAGFNPTKNSSLYVSYGMSDVGYEVDANNVNSNFGSLEGNNFGNYKNRNSSDIFGLGFKLRTGKNLFVLLEYSNQKIDLHSDHPAVFGGITSADINSTIESFKIGISKNL